MEEIDFATFKQALHWAEGFYWETLEDIVLLSPDEDGVALRPVLEVGDNCSSGYVIPHYLDFLDALENAGASADALRSARQVHVEDTYSRTSIILDEIRLTGVPQDWEELN